MNFAHRMTRRSMLKAAGVAMGLPWLDAMASAQQTRAPRPRRMVAVCHDMGLLPQYFFPEAAGRDYQLTPYLEILREFRNDFTVFSGVSHPHVDGGHAADICFLTGAAHPGRGGFRNTISLDQYAAQRMGSLTRFPHLNVIIGHEVQQNLSWTASGVRIPPEQRPSNVYRRLFVQGTASEVETRLRQLREGRSILDAVAESARGLERQVGPSDRHRLDQYFTSVRELEQQMVRAEEWENRPRPQVNEACPVDVADHNDTIAKSRLMYNVVKLALQTDSTRLITIMAQDQHSTHKIPGIDSHHALTHHGNRDETLSNLRRLEENQLTAFRDFLRALRGINEDGETLLDRTMVLQGAGMGNANAHTNNNLPVLIAGGGFRHGQHLVFDRQRNYPLANLFVSMLQRLGLETDRFATSTGTMRGLEMA